MDWNGKVEMMKLIDNSKNDKLGTEIFHDYVLEHMVDFENQDWDLFITGIDLIPDEMKSYIEFYTRLYECVKNVKSPSYRVAIRLARLEQICETNLNIK